MEQYIFAAQSYCKDVTLMKDTVIVDFFNKYNDSFEGFYYFCKDKFIYRSPNADISRFYYDPITGLKIDWNNIYEKYKHDIKDYSIKLEEKYNKYSKYNE